MGCRALAPHSLVDLDTDRSRAAADADVRARCLPCVARLLTCIRRSPRKTRKVHVTYYLRLHGQGLTALSLGGLVRFSGDVGGDDAPALRALGARLRGIQRLDIDLGALRRLGLPLVSWLIDVRRYVEAVGGRLTLSRVPSGLVRLLVILGLDHQFEVIAPSGDSRRRILRGVTHGDER